MGIFDQFLGHTSTATTAPAAGHATAGGVVLDGLPGVRHHSGTGTTAGASAPERLSVYELMRQDAIRARREQQRREEKLRLGNKKISKVFGKFDGSFYKDRKANYLDYYMPQVNDQFTDAKEQVQYALARAGLLNSSIAGDRMAKLLKQFETQKGSVVSAAQSDASGLRSRVNSEKEQLRAQLVNSGDVSQTMDSALSSAKQLYNDTPIYNPLGDIFAGAATGIGGILKAQQNQALVDAYFGGLGGTSGGSGFRTVQ